MKEPELTLRPSQWLNSGWILFGLVGIPFVVPTLIAIFKMVETYCHRYDFYEDHILESKGIFNVIRREVHYFRVKSILIDEPFLYRVVDLSSIHIKTSDQFNQEFTLKAIPVGRTLVNDLKAVVKVERAHHNVREFDMYDL
jgi:membrane protein YdbS with pleckstrin-like domain